MLTTWPSNSLEYSTLTIIATFQSLYDSSGGLTVLSDSNLEDIQGSDVRLEIIRLKEVELLDIEVDDDFSGAEDLDARRTKFHLEMAVRSFRVRRGAKLSERVLAPVGGNFLAA